MHVIARREGEKKLNELIARRQAKQDELADATQRYLAHRRSPQHSALELEAEALLTGEQVKVGADAGDLEKLQHEIEVINTAIEQQTRLLDPIRGKYSVVICDDNRDQYVAIERRIARAVAELAAANEAEAIHQRRASAA